MASAEYTPISLAGADRNAGSLTSPVEHEADGLHLFIDNPAVATMPEEGLITFRYRRGPLSLRESSGERPGSANADFTLTEICEVKEEKASSAVEAEAKDVVDELFESISKAAAEKAGDEAGDE